MIAISPMLIRHNCILFFIKLSHFVMFFEIYISIWNIISLFIGYLLFRVDICRFLLFTDELIKGSISYLWYNLLMRFWIVLCRNSGHGGTMLDLAVFFILVSKIELERLLSRCQSRFILCQRCRVRNLRVYRVLWLWWRLISLILMMFLPLIRPW